MDLIRRTIHVSIKNNTYIFATIAINRKVEMFYHFPWGGNYKTENIINDKLEDAHLPDHISFHANGVVHFTYKNNRKRSAHYKDQHFQVNPFNVPENNAWLLLIESVNKPDFRLKESESIKEEDIRFDLGNNDEFSLLIYAIPARFNPKYLIEGAFAHLKIIDQGVVWLSAYTVADKVKLPQKSACMQDTNLVLLFVKNVIPETHGGKFTEGGELQLSLCIAPPPNDVKNILPFKD